MAEPSKRERCPSCGHLVKVPEENSVKALLFAQLLWVPDEQEWEERVEKTRAWAKDEQHKREQAKEEIVCAHARERECREVLRRLHTAVLNVGGGVLHDLYQNSDMRNLVERMLKA